MGIIDDIIAQDARMYVDPDLMPGVEQITYTPRGGTPKLIYVQVERETPFEMPGMPAVLQPTIKIGLARDATYGMLLVNIGGDRVMMNVRQNDPTTVATMAISKIYSEDAGMFRLKVG